MTSGSSADETPNEAPAPDADPGLEAIELAARISRRLGASDTPTPHQRMPTPRPPALG